MNSTGDILDAIVPLPITSDRELVERFRQGDREAFSAIYLAHSPAVFRFALHMMGDRTKATDITQDVFVWLIHHRTAFDAERGTLPAFLAGVTRQFIRQKHREERRWVPFEEIFRRQPVESPDPGRGIDADAFRKAIAILPLRYREPVVLCDLEGHTYAEAAALLNCAVGTIRSRLNRAHELLARKFQLRKNP